MQYIAPTIQRLLAVLVYGESFTGPRVTGFAMIWIALAIYAADSAWRFRKTLPVR